MSRLRPATCTCWALLSALVFSSAAFAGSETPPPGPEWRRDFHAAQQEALRGGKPLFVYFTKTY